MPALILAALLLGLHPLHTTHTDLADAGGQVTLQVRAFTDDLSTAARRRLGAVDDSALARYVRGTVLLLDPAGRAITLAWQGRQVQGEVTLLRFTAVGLTALAGARVRQSMHMELFSDQVNVVQAHYRGQRQSLLFVPGDEPKRLP